MVRRGDVWWVDLGESFGSEPGYLRPALIVSSDRFNRSRIATVLLVPLTSNLRRAAAPGNVELAAGEGALSKDCVVNVSQMLVADRSRLVEHSGSLSSPRMRQVDEGLRLLLAL